MSSFPQDILLKLADAEENDVDMKSPKAVVTHLLAQGEKDSILFFYKPNSLEFDFEKYNRAVAEMRSHQSK